jgi:hypothetical protein
MRKPARVYASADHPRSLEMTLCPIAIVTGCKKCPAFSVCPLKSVIGDMPKEGEVKAKEKKK